MNRKEKVLSLKESYNLRIVQYNYFAEELPKYRRLLGHYFGVSDLSEEAIVQKIEAKIEKIDSLRTKCKSLKLSRDKYKEEYRLALQQIEKLKKKKNFIRKIGSKALFMKFFFRRQS